MEDELVLSAVMRELGVIGEAAKKLSEEFKRVYTNVPWKQIAGMRDKLIHDYFEIDVEAVWKTAQEDIPFLKQELQK
ncbi:MAG: HepT-like ribonuclease domain-containing protein [Patescibacteria group bacterium]